MLHLDVVSKTYVTNTVNSRLLRSDLRPILETLLSASLSDAQPTKERSVAADHRPGVPLLCV